MVVSINSYNYYVATITVTDGLVERRYAIEFSIKFPPLIFKVENKTT